MKIIMNTLSSKIRAAVDAADFAVPAAAGAMQAEPSTTREAGGSAAGRFLAALFGTKPAELFILIWFLRGKVSHWFQDMAAAVAYVEQHADDDVYVGVALSPTDFGRDRRCAARDTAGIVGLWLDLDFLSEAHKKENLPATLEEALGLIPADLPPSLVVHSGHGGQVWWLFENPWIFKDSGDREAAAGLANSLKTLFKYRAAAHGWDVDSVADLARVMRVPGTTNKKVPGAFRPVELTELNDRRYTPEEIRVYLDRAGVPATRFAATASATASVNQPATLHEQTTDVYVIDPAANPPFDKFELLCDVEPRFRESWEHKRGADLQDRSPSGYDLSLATFAAQTDWTDQEIVNLLIGHRRKHGEKEKLRPDYLRRTIAKARASAAEYWKEVQANEVLQALSQGAGGADGNGLSGGAEAAEEGDGHADQLTLPVPTGEPGVRRRAILSALAVRFKVPIKRVVKFTGDDPRYRLETELGDVHLGNVNGLICQNKLRSSIAATTDKYLPHFDDRTWPAIARLLLEACEKIDRGCDVTLIGTMTEWLREYLRHKQPHESLEEADEGREPFTRDGAVYIFADNLRHWLAVQQGERVTRNSLTADLRAFGAVPEPFELAVGRRRTTRSAWKIPAGLWETEAEQPGSDQP